MSEKANEPYRKARRRHVDIAFSYMFETAHERKRTIMFELVNISNTQKAGD